MESDEHHKESNNSMRERNFQIGSQNLSGVLNDPNIGRQINFFKRDWGNEFTDRPSQIKPSYLPEISNKDFAEYHREFSRPHLLHVMAKETFMKDNFPPDILQHFPTLRNLRPLIGVGQGDIGKIPEIFFDPNFNLQKKDIFDQVFVGSQPIDCNERTDPPYDAVVKGSQSTVRLLQAKLFHYLDIVEIQISNQVKQKSGHFFGCIASHNDLTDRLAKTRKIVQIAREDVNRIQIVLLEKSFDVLRMKIRQKNYVQLYQRLKLVAVVTKTTCVIQHLLSCSDYMTAVDTVGILKDMFSHELFLIKSLRFQRAQMSEIENVIDTRLNEEFELYVTEYLNIPLSNNCGEEICDDDHQLSKIIFGILRRKHFHSFDEYKRILLIKIKEVVKIVEKDIALCISSKTTCVKSNIEYLKQLPVRNWMDFLKTLTGNLMTTINRIKDQKKFIHQVVTSFAKTTEKDFVFDQQNQSNFKVSHLEERLLSTDEITMITSKLHNAIAVVCDFSGQLVSRFINSYWSAEKASACEVSHLGQLIDSFNDECNSICGRSSTCLDGVVTCQADKFVQNFHKERKEQLKLILNNECWRSVDVPKDFQELLDEIMRTGNFRVLKLNSETSEPNRFLLVNKEPYKVAGASLILLKMMAEYCTCASELPVMASMTYRCLTELIQFFNARSCELLLGTTALYTAGLKTITVGNLAISARSLQLVAFLLHFIAQHFQTIVQMRNKSSIRVQELKDFEIFKRAIEEHIEEIEKKITSISSSAVNKQLSQWCCTLPVPSQAFLNIVKQLRKIHDALGDILTLAQIHDIYRAVHEEFSRNLQEQLKRMVVPCQEEKQEAIQVEVTFYADFLEELGVLSKGEIYGPLDNIMCVVTE